MSKGAQKGLNLDIDNEVVFVNFFVGGRKCGEKLDLYKILRDDEDHQSKIFNIFSAVVKHPNANCCKGKLRTKMEKWLRDHTAVAQAA